MIWFQCESNDCAVNVESLANIKIVDRAGKYEVRCYYLRPVEGGEYEVLVFAKDQMDAKRALARALLLIVNAVPGVHKFVDTDIGMSGLEKKVIDGLRSIDRPMRIGVPNA